MTIQATVIEDSISDANIRLTTFQLRYPRFIHAELMTHRVFSRNASSSRAIPVKKMIEDLRQDPAMPVFWGSNQPGMQAGDELNGHMLERCKDIWLEGRDAAITTALELMSRGLHKQIANRVLEPWGHINVVVTATDYRNFYALRRHPDAQPEIKVLADAMFEAQARSVPNFCRPGDWHLPYIMDSERMAFTTPEEIQILKKVSVARCARVSYLTHEGKQTSVEEDIALFERLVHRHPIHASPAEHQATPDWTREDIGEWATPHEHGNLRGWRQLRKMIDGEYIAG